MEINLKRLLRDLTNPDGDLRALSAMTLMKVEVIDSVTREGVIAALMKATHDKNIAVRFFSRKAIDKLRQVRETEGSEPPPVQPIDKGLESENYDERLGAVMRISREEKKEYKDRLIEMLKSERHDFVKASLISCLKNFVDKSQAELFSPFLTDPDGRVRSNAIEALEAIKAEIAIPLLFPILEDPDNRIRAAAAKALQAFGQEKVFFNMKKMLQSNEEWMKVSAIHSLSHINASDSITLLVDAAKATGQVETRLKAIIALANFHDLTPYGFLKFTSTSGEDPFKQTAARALKLMEEKFGSTPPTSTIVVDKTPEKAAASGGKDVKKAGSNQDIGGSVAQFFRKGKEQAVDLSKNAAIQYALTDLKKEADELLKEAGRIVFEIYQRGDLQVPDLLTLSHEILRMNFFIQKYTDEAERNAPKGGGGLFASLKSLFGKAATKDPKLLQAEKFTQKREELFQRLGSLSFKKYRDNEFNPAALEGYYKTHQKLEDRIQKEKERIG
ncbi:MAG: HEAT repeat domain-containing protein [Candidatus Ozemobacteraceae bacterium]